jgi:DNA-binding IclR family transcriptional regulator
LALTPDPPTLDTRGPLALQDLATALQLTVRLGVLKKRDLAYIEKTPDLVPCTSFPNRARLPVHATALSKALLAFAPAVVVQRLAAGGLARFTEYTPTSISELGRAVVHARRHGFTTSDRELNLAIRGVAAPVLDASGLAAAAIEVHVLPRPFDLGTRYSSPDPRRAGPRSRTRPDNLPVRRDAWRWHPPETFTARGRTATWPRPRSTNSHRC